MRTDALKYAFVFLAGAVFGWALWLIPALPFGPSLLEQKYRIWELEDELQCQTELVQNMREALAGRQGTRLNINQPPVKQPVNTTVSSVEIDADGRQRGVVLALEDAKKDAIEIGTEFIIYRDNQYIVQVRVVEISQTTVQAYIISDTWNSKTLGIQAGDLATNRLF